MATNEHSNLSNDNLHVPLDFSTASNSTVLTKNSDGELEWDAVGSLKTHTITLRGFCSPANSNYYYPANMDVNKDLEFTKDYGASTIDNATVISVSNMLRSSIFVVPADCNISNVCGWISGKDATETVTFALVKGSNVTIDLATEFQVGGATNTMVILDEFTALTYNNNLKLGSIDNSSFVASELEKGDFLMPMIKHPSGANDTYFNMSIELKYAV